MNSGIDRHEPYFAGVAAGVVSLLLAVPGAGNAGVNGALAAFAAGAAAAGVVGWLAGAAAVVSGVLPGSGLSGGTLVTWVLGAGRLATRACADADAANSCF